MGLFQKCLCFKKTGRYYSWSCLVLTALELGTNQLLFMVINCLNCLLEQLLSSGPAELASRLVLTPINAIKQCMFTFVKLSKMLMRFVDKSFQPHGWVWVGCEYVAGQLDQNI